MVNGNSMEGLNRLEVYQVALDLAKTIYKDVINQLPKEEKWGLKSQIRRAAASVPANIAEGYGRYYYQETIRFCYLARGSLMELMSHIQLSESAGYISKDLMLVITQKANSALRLINGYINYLKQSKRGDDEPGSHISDIKSNYLLENNFETNEDN